MNGFLLSEQHSGTSQAYGYAHGLVFDFLLSKSPQDLDFVDVFTELPLFKQIPRELLRLFLFGELLLLQLRDFKVTGIHEVHPVGRVTLL